MVFSSAIFAFWFLPLFLAGYLTLAGASRWVGLAPCNAWLLMASLLFYAWGEPQYLVLLIACVAFNYGVGRLIGACEPWRRHALALGVVGNLGVLGYFKYAGLFVATVSSSSAFVAPPLPLGVSFFVFQSLSYLFDVERKTAPAEKNPLYLGLYIAMFPQLVAGPIVRFGTIFGQIRKRRHGLGAATRGAFEFSVGLAQKVLIANTLALTADAVFARPAATLDAGAVWLGVVTYGLQIYFDFSGYSHMAIGLGRICGFDFPENFDFPYASPSVSVFWRRWHMTLSRWFRDYVYIPAGGNRHGRIRTGMHLGLVFFLCGLWHGAAWAFVVWGLYHGALLTIERVGGGRWLQNLPRPAQHLYTLVVVSIGWVFFRADDLEQAGHLVAVMFGATFESSYRFDVWRFLRNDVVLAGAVAVVVSGPWMRRWHRALVRRFDAQPDAVSLEGLRNAATLALLALSLLAVGAGGHDPFIYFRF